MYVYMYVYSIYVSTCVYMYTPTHIYIYAYVGHALNDVQPFCPRMQTADIAATRTEYVNLKNHRNKDVNYGSLF